MAIIPEQIPEGLALIDPNASNLCGIVIDSNGVVTHVLKKPESQEDKDFAAEMGDVSSEDDGETPKKIAGCDVYLKKNILNTQYENGMKLSQFLAAWLAFDADHATQTDRPSVSANEFFAQLIKAPPSETSHQLFDLAITKPGKGDEPVHESARTLAFGVYELYKKLLFDSKNGLSTELRDYLIAYNKDLPTSKITPSKG